MVVVFSDRAGSVPVRQDQQCIPDRAFTGRVGRIVDHLSVDRHRGRPATVEIDRVAQAECPGDGGALGDAQQAGSFARFPIPSGLWQWLAEAGFVPEQLLDGRAG